jgi:hypothetical protein
MSTFILSIETNVRTYQHPYHLGTIESVARKCASDIFDHLKPQINGEYIVSVALIRDGKLFDVYDGEWHSGIGFE